MTQPQPPQGSTAPSTSAHPPRRRGAARLPWTLVAILSVLSLVLLNMVGVRDREIATLKADAAATPAASATTAPSASAPTTSPAALVRNQADDPRAIGSLDAPVVMLEFADFRCPFCAVWANQTLPELLPYVEAGSLRIEFHDMAIFGAESELAAVGARAAASQGKFWEYSVALYGSAPPEGGHPTITKDDTIGFAKLAEVPDLAAFEAALADEAALAGVRTETGNAAATGITGVPFFVVNSTIINGAQPTATFITVIEQLGAHT